MRLSKRPKRPADDGIVPLINIVFLLLIFFLIVGTIAPTPDIAVTYPETDKSPVSRAPVEALYVSAGGFLSYGGNSVDPDSLPALVRGVLVESDGAPLPVVVDRSLPAGDLAPVLGKIAAGGAKTVKLITLRARTGQAGSGS